MLDTSEIKAAVAKLANAFDEHRRTNNLRLREIEEHGSADPLLDEKLAKISKAMDSFTGEIAKGVDDLEQFGDRIDTLETAYGRRGGGGSEDDSAINGTKALVAFDSWRKNRPVEPEEVEITASELASYRKALGRYIRRTEIDLLDEDKAALRIGKALSVGVEGDGGYWVTPEMDSRLIKRQFLTSPMRQFATVMTIGSDALELVTDTNDATSGGWVGEKDARAESATPQIGKQRIPVHEQFANPSATQKLLDDSSFDVEQWLTNKISDRMIRTENLAFVSGNGVDQPRGFLDYSGAAVTTDDDARAWGILQYVFTGKSAAFDTDTVDATASPADELVDLQSKLKPVFRPNARWFMSRATEAEVRKLRATTGEYLVTLNTGNITGVPVGSFMLLGFQIANFEDMPAIAANSFSIAYGDMQAAYTVVERQGTRILRDPFTSKPFVLFYTTRRVGGDLVDSDALKLLKFGTS